MKTIEKLFVFIVPVVAIVTYCSIRYGILGGIISYFGTVSLEYVGAWFSFKFHSKT